MATAPSAVKAQTIGKFLQRERRDRLETLKIAEKYDEIASCGERPRAVRCDRQRARAPRMAREGMLRRAPVEVPQQ